MADMMVDLAYTKAELKEEQKEMAVGCDGQPNPYPWGLCLHLEGNELDKLGMTQLPQVGSEVHFMAHAKVTSVSQSANEDRDEQRTVALQIVAMSINSGEST